MKLKSHLFELMLLAAVVGVPGLSCAGEAEATLAKEFPPQSITTLERANAALALVPAARSEINDRAQREKAECYERFLVSSCLIDARASDRKASKMVRQIEVQANALLRRERAAERDRAVAEREKRAAEQRAKAISITGATRDSESPEDAPDANDSRP